jgi:phage-related protein
MKKTDEYIAYEGNCFTIEWYFDGKDQSSALEYYQSLSDGERIKVLMLFKRMGDVGEIKDKTKFTSEGDKIYAFKPQPHRFLCFFYKGKKIIVTNGFRKKQQKLPKGEKDKALQAHDDYVNKVKAGEYYE